MVQKHEFTLICFSYMMMKVMVTMIISVYYFLYLLLLLSIFSFIPVTDIIILKMRQPIMCEQFKPKERESRIP
jgi:hypothetical protein